MKNKRTKYIGIIVVLLMLTLVACSGKKDKNASNNEAVSQSGDDDSDKANDKKVTDAVILTVGDIKVSYNEVMVYVLLLRELYEPNFTDVIWDYKLDTGSTFGEMAKEEILNQIIQLKIMNLEAKNRDIVLTDDELIEIENYANKYIAGITTEDQEKYGINYDTVFGICKDNYLAEKVFDVATMDVDTSISDEEAKQVTVWQIAVLTSSKDKNGEVIALSDEEKEAARSKAKDLLKKVKKEEDFYTFALSKSDDPQVEYTIGSGDKSDEYVDAAFALKEGKLSKVIEDETGFYILYCVNPFNEDATAQKKEEIISQRQDEAFQKLYKEWLENYKIKITQENWDGIQF
ncbi:peptidylprolyl isomerase [Anaerosporobacter sp.]|uniref:peptidylprolyl isomerase n=1 Tax=Anaerosporobacter sp. TaxID=1872529 RepID=UPI00286F3B7F|nr:peptidylprolyl isomerase [Anaerosporobacter sp.]